MGLFKIIKKLIKKDMIEHFEEVDAIMQRLVGKENHRHDAQVIRELFNAHNVVFPNNREYSTSCSGCRQRVYNRLKGWWQDNGGVKRQQ